MTSIFYCNCKFFNDYQLYTFYCDHKNYFSKNCIDRYESYKHTINARNFLIGRLLLRFGLSAFNARLSILDIMYTSNNKPYFEKGPYFNISHSGDIVMCAMSDFCDLGIDVEQIIKLDIDQFRDCFTIQEIQNIFDSENSLNQFYQLWTKKEAIIKADGRGFGIDVREINVLMPRISIGSAVWGLFPIRVDPEYVAHLALNISGSKGGSEPVELFDVSFHSLLDFR